MDSANAVVLDPGDVSGRQRCRSVGDVGQEPAGNQVPKGALLFVSAGENTIFFKGL